MNYQEEQNEGIINFKYLFIYILKKWRVLIIAMLVGAVLLGIYRARFKPQTILVDTTQQQEIQDKIEENNDSISEYTLKIKENESKTTKNEETIKTYQAELEIQKDLVSDLEGIIDTYSKAGSQAAFNLANANVQLTAAKKKVSVYEIQIKDLQQENSQLPETNSALKEKVNKLKDNNKDLKESLSPQLVKAGKLSIIKYAILGAFLGAFVICGIAFLKYILYKKLRNADELRERYNVRVIGSLYVIPGKMKNNKIDRILNKWSGFNYEIDEEKQYKLISSSIQVMSSSKQEKIILTGTLDQTQINQVREKLNEFLPQDGYQLCTVTNPVYDADALLNIKESLVILVEAKDVSNIYEIEKLMDVLRMGKAELLGAVML